MLVDMLLVTQATLVKLSLSLRLCSNKNTSHNSLHFMHFT